MYNLPEFLYNTCPWFTTLELYNNGTMLKKFNGWFLLALKVTAGIVLQF
jgi:hypothetical protein